MVKKNAFELNQGISKGRYSALKIFHHPEKLESLLDGKVTSPLYVRIKPTNNCNHSCFYCVYDSEFSSIHELTDRRDEIPRDKMNEILDDLGEMGVRAITYSGGGEPLVYPHINEAIRKTVESGIGLSMITNGQSLEGQSAELLASEADWIRVSLDYADAETFEKIRKRPERSFAQLKRNLESFGRTKKDSCDFGVNCVVNHLNYTKLFDIAKFCKSLGVTNLRFAPLWNQDFMRYHLQLKDQAIEQVELAKGLQEDDFSVGSTYDRYFNGTTASNQRLFNRCFYMEIVPVIAADQNIYTCHNNAYESDGRVGSIKDKSFKEMWFSQETAEFFGKFDHKSVCTHECSNDEKNQVLNEFSECGDESISRYI